MMSIVIKDEISKKLYLYVKGADTSVLPICDDMTDQDD